MTTHLANKKHAPGDVLYEDTLAPACHWSLRMRKGTILKLIDIEGGANLGMLFYNPEIFWSAITPQIHSRDSIPSSLPKATACTRIWGAFSVPLLRTRWAGTKPCVVIPQKEW